MAGKGDKPRPRRVSKEEYDSNYQKIFGKDIKKKGKDEK